VLSDRLSQRPEPALKRVAAGLYRSSATGVYFAHVRVHGKLFRESLETRDRKTAERKLKDFRRDKERVDHRAGKISIAVLCDRYGETLDHLSASSLRGKLAMLRLIKQELRGGSATGVAEVKPSDCDRWIARQSKRVGRSHLNAYVQLLRALFEFALRDRLISENPAAHIKYFKRPKPIHLTPTWEEFQAIVKDIRAQQFNAVAEESGNFVEFIGLAGLGQAEASALTWDDIDFNRKQITTFRHKTSTGFVVPIFPWLEPLLLRLHGASKHPAGRKIFAIKDAKKAIAGACVRLNLPKFTHRSFRRMFVTRALEKGVNVKVVSLWQGHRDGGKLILDTYSHVAATHSEEMARLLTNAIPN